MKNSTVVNTLSDFFSTLIEKSEKDRYNTLHILTPLELASKYYRTAPHNIKNKYNLVVFLNEEKTDEKYPANFEIRLAEINPTPLQTQSKEYILQLLKKEYKTTLREFAITDTGVSVIIEPDGDIVKDMYTVSVPTVFERKFTYPVQDDCVYLHLTPRKQPLEYIKDQLQDRISKYDYHCTNKLCERTLSEKTLYWSDHHQYFHCPHCKRRIEVSPEELTEKLAESSNPVELHYMSRKEIESLVRSWLRYFYRKNK